MHMNRKLYRRIADKLAAHYRRFGPIAFAWGGPAMGLGMLFVLSSTLACNLQFSLRGASQRIVRNCSTAVIHAQMWGR